ncbi:MAG: hypothetical protein ACOCYP_06490 [Planctomycetota bacterium]
MARGASTRPFALLAALLVLIGCGEDKLYDLYIDRAPGVQEHHVITSRANLDRIAEGLLAEIRDGRVVLRPDGQTPAIQGVFVRTENEREVQTAAGTHRTATTLRIASPRFVLHAPGSTGEWPVSADVADDDASWQCHAAGKLDYVMSLILSRIHTTMVDTCERHGAPDSDP